MELNSWLALAASEIWGYNFSDKYLIAFQNFGNGLGEAGGGVGCRERGHSMAGTLPGPHSPLKLSSLSFFIFPVIKIIEWIKVLFIVRMTVIAVIINYKGPVFICL